MARGLTPKVERVDLLVVGELDLNNVSGLVKEQEGKLGREINYSVMTKGEFDEMLTHGALTFSQGSGILPSGPGPAIQAVKNITKALTKGESVSEALVKEILPVQWQRAEDILSSIKDRTVEGKVPIGKMKGLPFQREVSDVYFEQGLGRSLFEIAGPKTAERTEKSAEWYKQSRMDLLEGKRKRLIAELIAGGQGDKAQELIKKYQVVPTRDSIHEAMLRRNVPREQRARYQKAAQRQRVRELKSALDQEETQDE